MNVFNVIEKADLSAEPVGFESTAGAKVVGLRLEDSDNLVFADADAGTYMTQALFYSRYRWDQFTALDEVPEIFSQDDDLADADPDGDPDGDYPDIGGAVAWASDLENVTDEQVQAYLVEVAGEDNRRRNRDTAIEKVQAYVDAQQ